MEGGGQASRTVRKAVRLRSTSADASAHPHFAHTLGLAGLLGTAINILSNILGKLELRLTNP